jgi:hypothetical protein
MFIVLEVKLNAQVAIPVACLEVANGDAVLYQMQLVVLMVNIVVQVDIDAPREVILI